MLGDPTGIGPEVALKLLARPETHQQARILVVGDRRIFDQTAQSLGLPLKARLVDPRQPFDWPQPGAPEVAMMDLGNMDPAQVTQGAADHKIGWLVGETLKVMTDLALE